jgi:hypothetical protein
MISRNIFAIVVIGLALPNCAYANLGDNDAKIEDAYGDIIQRHLRDDGTVSVLYRKDRYLHFVIFDKQLSVLEALSRVDGRDLSAKEISRYLKDNAGRATWVRIDSSSERRYQRSDHKAEAAYLILGGRPTLRVRNMRVMDEK